MPLRVLEMVNQKAMLLPRCRCLLAEVTITKVPNAWHDSKVSIHAFVNLAGDDLERQVEMHASAAEHASAVFTPTTDGAHLHAWECSTELVDALGRRNQAARRRAGCKLR